MPNDYYTHGSYPATGAPGRSADLRAELNSIDAGFSRLPQLGGNAYKVAYVNAGETGWGTLGGSGLLKLRAADIPTLAIDGTDYVSPAVAAALTNKTIVVASNTITTTAHGTLVATELNAALAELADDGAATAAALAALGLPGLATGGGITVSTGDRLLGRATAGAGAIEEIVCTSAGRDLLDDASTAAQRITLGLVIGTDVQAYDVNIVKKNVANTFTAVQAPVRGTAAVSTTSTFSFNPSTHGQMCEITLTNAITVTLAVAAGTLVAGAPYTLIFKAGDTSSRSFAKGATFLAPSGVLPVVSGSVTTNASDVFHCIASDANTLMVVGTSADVR